MSALNKRIQFIKTRRNGRSPSNYPADGCGVALRITRLFPMKLKEITPEKLERKGKESELFCINEMMSLFDCFEKNDFSKTMCIQHVTALEQCVGSSHKNKRKK